MIWHEKLLFSMYVTFGMFLAIFSGVGRKKHCLVI